MAEKPPSKFWELLGKLTAVLAFIGMLVGLYQTYNTPRSDLSAEVRWSAIIYPDSLAASYTELRKKLSAESLQKAVGWSDADLQTVDLRHKLDALTRYVSDQIPTSPPFPLNRTAGIWRFTVKNSGNLPVEDVTLVVPDGIYVMIKREAVPDASEKISGVVNIGKLRALEDLSVDVWSLFEPDEFRAKRLRLTCSAGVGRLSWKYTTGYVGHLADQFLAFPLGLFFIILIGFILHAKYGHIVIWPGTRATEESDKPAAKFDSASRDAESSIGKIDDKPQVTSSTPTQSSNAALQSAGDYFAFFEKISERPAERDNWVAGVEGAAVKWDGIYSDVNQTKGSKTITVVLRATNSKTRWSQFFAEVPVGLKDVVYSLHKGDQLSVSGTLVTERMAYAPTIIGATITRVK